MTQLTTQPITAPIINDQYSPIQIALDDTLFAQCQRLAQIMSSGACTVPKHLQGNVGDCFAIVGQALRWGFDPYAVAQKTHLVNGTLGYEAQLIIAVINAKAPITGRLKFDYFGDWKKVKAKDDESNDVGVIVSATIKGDDEPTTLSLSMAQVGKVRNSPLWTNDPRQQLAYLAAKRWARLHCPDVILGLYSEDELQDRNAQPKDITPTATKNSGTQSIKDRIKIKRETQVEVEVADAEVDCYDINPKLIEIRKSTTLAELNKLGQDIADIKTNENLCGDDLKILKSAWSEQKNLIVYNDLRDKINLATLDTAATIRANLFANQKFLSDEQFSKLDNTLDDVINKQVDTQA